MEQEQLRNEKEELKVNQSLMFRAKKLMDELGPEQCHRLVEYLQKEIQEDTRPVMIFPPTDIADATIYGMDMMGAGVQIRGTHLPVIGVGTYQDDKLSSGYLDKLKAADNFTSEFLLSPQQINPDPIDVINIYLEKEGKERKDLIGIIGDKTLVSRIMNRKRKLTPKMIRNVSRYLSIPVDKLIKDYKLGE